MNADLHAIVAEGVLAVGGMVLLVLPRIRSARWLGGLTLALLAAAAWLKLTNLPSADGAAAFSGMLALDRFGLFFQIAMLAATALVTLSVVGYAPGGVSGAASFSGSHAREEVRGRRELYALLLFTATGLLLLAGAQHLALIYLGLELVSILSYLLVGFHKRESFSIEAALKYFLFGAVSTGAMLYGISLIYGLTGTMDLPALAVVFPRAADASPLVALAAGLLLIVGLGFKLALVPFHMWAPDAYEGAPTPVALFISLGPKLAGFAVMARILLSALPSAAGDWPALLAALSVVTMTFGNVAALHQTNLKRLLAYSSIAHAGTLVIGLAAGTPLGLAALLYYGVAYVLMNAGAFLGVIAVGNAAGREDVGAVAGLSQRSPAVAALITLCFLSLAGIPPLAGFFAKMWIFGAALDAGLVWLAVAAAVNSVIALFYYLRVIKGMYLDPAPAGAGPIPPSRPLLAGLSLCALGLVAVGLWQGPWLELSARAVPLRADSAPAFQ